MCDKSLVEIKTTSSIRTTYYGVPQGSVLGPLLFLVYINDLPRIVNHPMVLFADDSTVIFSTENRELHEIEINKTLNYIIDWLKYNNLNINFDKTKIINFGHMQNNSPKYYDIQYDGHKIGEVSDSKFLGIFIDKALTWKTHIDSICKRLNQYSYALSKLSKIVNKNTVLTAYHAFVTSTLRYGIIFWGNSTDRERAFKAQKKCVRAMCNICIPNSCQPHFIELKIHTLPSLYVYEMALFVKSNFQIFTTLKSKRHANIISSFPSRSALMSKNIQGMSSLIFNAIPNDIRNINNINIFKKKLTKFLIEKAYYTIQEFLADTNCRL
jgi:hypothetical protein